MSGDGGGAGEERRCDAGEVCGVDSVEQGREEEAEGDEPGGEEEGFAGGDLLAFFGDEEEIKGDDAEHEDDKSSPERQLLHW